MAAKEIVVKKYVVRLSCGERSLLETLIRKGSNPAQRLLKARILLKADVSEAGEGWSDNQIIQAGLNMYTTTKTASAPVARIVSWAPNLISALTALAQV